MKKPKKEKEQPKLDASVTNWTTVGLWMPVAQRRSSHCPYCTPRCPHGYPADDYSPHWTTPFVVTCDGSCGSWTGITTSNVTLTGGQS